MAAWSERDIPDLSGQRALVTGGASGIGYEAARALAQHGAQVLIVNRDEQRGTEAVRKIRDLAPGAGVEFALLDLAHQQAVKDFALRLVAEGKPLHLLINNAGLQPVTARHVTVDGFELTFGTGHLGHFTLTGLLLPLLLGAPAPRVVTVSSMMHGAGWFDWDDLQIEKGHSSQRPYTQTKLANLLFARELQRRADAAGRKLLSVAVHPGIAKTNIGAARLALGATSPVDRFITVLIPVVNALFGQSAQGGALPTLYAATSPEAQGGGFYGPAGFGELKGAPVPAEVKKAAQDPAVGQRLWEVSEQLTGVHYQALG